MVRLTAVIHSVLQGRDYTQSLELCEVRFDSVNGLVEFIGKDDEGEEVYFSTRLVKP